MSENQETAPATSDAEVDLESYVAENPEEVARLLDRLDVVNELLDVGAIATAAMDDEMVESVTETSANLAMAADGMATEDAVQLGEAVGENAEDVADGLETVARLQRTGTLDDLAQLAELASLGTSAMDDEMVESITATGGRLAEVADTAADDDVAGGLENLLAAVGEADTDEPNRVGAVGLVKAIRDPEVQAGLGVLVSVAKALGAQTEQ